MRLLFAGLWILPATVHGWTTTKHNRPSRSFATRSTDSGSRSVRWATKREPEGPENRNAAANGGTNPERLQQQRQLDNLVTRNLIQALLQPKPTDGGTLIPLILSGQASLPTPLSTVSLFPPNINNASNTNQMDCAVLSEATTVSSAASQPCLLLPMPRANPWWLLQQVARIHGSSNTSDTTTNPFQSRVQLLLMNSVWINRDGGLFDTLPYTTWWNDPRAARVDAADNPMAAQFHMGKRTCYNRFMGQDWYRDRQQPWKQTPSTESSRTESFRTESSFAQALNRFMTPWTKNRPSNEATTSTVSSGDVPVTSNTLDTALYSDFPEPFSDSPDGTVATTDSMTQLLQQRIRQVQLREWQMDLAECDYEIATRSLDAGGTDTNRLEWHDKRTAILSLVEELQAEEQQQMDQLVSDSSLDLESMSWMSSLNSMLPGAPLDTSLQSTAMDTTTTESTVPNKYASPYALLQSILLENMKAEVVGTVLENASLLNGTIVLGGLVVLRRIVDQTSVSILGETVTVNVDTTDATLPSGGTMVLVECDADEAIGLSMACGVPLYVESNVWERGSVMCAPRTSATTKDLVTWKPLDPELSILTEGQASNQSLTTERAAPIRVSRFSRTLFDTILQSRQEQQATSQDLFPTDNPIQSLSQLDGLSLDEKARTLMGMSNFDKSLPRPRVLRTENPLALDQLLLPLIDESVRRQYFIRDAQQRGDVQRVTELQAATSQRGLAKAQADQARERGDDEVAEYWDQEADLYASLRADVTQDEGSYNRFLDRDEWYERDRQRMVQRMLKKSGQ